MLLRQKIGLVLFGISLCFILLELGLRLGGFAILLLREHRNISSLKQRGASYCILCLGESTTALGEDDSWPAQLEKVLNDRNIGIRFKIINGGREASESSAILSFLNADLDKYKPDMVIAMMGVNDWVGTLPYEDTLFVRARLFINNFRIYKLTKLIWLHIINKIKEVGQTNMMPLASLQENNSYNPENYLYCRNGHIKINPADEQTYVDSGYSYYEQGRYNEAEAAFKKAIEINPMVAAAYIGLGQCYREQGRYKEMGRMAEEAIKIDPDNEDAYILLGNSYQDREDYEKAEKMFKVAIELNPKWEPAYTELGKCYSRQRKEKEIQGLVKKIIKEKLDNDRLHGFVATSFWREGKYSEAEEYYKKANKFRSKYYNPATRHNYRLLKEIIMQKGIKLVCMQYPMRSAEPLKKLFDSTEGIIFVDNERVFRDALERTGYENLFVDNFGGDFGHATPRGNRLIAENAANVIIKEVFGR